MSKKKYYDKDGNPIRSKPTRRFYHYWWFKLLILVTIVSLVFLGIDIFKEKDEGIEPFVSESNDNSTPDEESSNVVIETEDEITENQEIVENNDEEPAYTYDDIKGAYVIFDGEPYNSTISSVSNIVVLGDDFYQSFNRWDFDMISFIIDKNIEDNRLTLELDSDEQVEWGRHSETGTEQFILSYDNGKKALNTETSDTLLYSMTTEDLQNHYNQLEIDYARIIMTIHGEPSLDQWAMWEIEWGKPVIRVRKNSANDLTDISDKVSYPKDVTHLDLTSQGMAAGVITYSTEGNGYITRYPMPLHYHQEDQSEEGYRKLAQEAIDNAQEFYVEPFEPYAVADFIGRVEFVYE